MIKIRKSETADTRTCDYANVSKDTLYIRTGGQSMTMTVGA